PMEGVLQETLESLLEQKVLEREGSSLKPGPGDGHWNGHRWLHVYAQQLLPFFDAYALAAQSLDRLLISPLREKDLMKEALNLGQEQLAQGIPIRREAISKPLLSNAYHAFSELGYLTTRAGSLELREEHQDRASLAELVAKISVRP
ncbi:MAG: hypothetical protein MK135_14535, partial [Polyangiaceae bacterium]|nr:hypothetical protein [Polyangiaceae bacterium]